MKPNFSKKEIRHNLEAALISEIEKMEGSESSRKIKKVVKKISKGIALKVKLDMKKNFRKAARKRHNVDSKKGLKGFRVETAEKVENGHEKVKIGRE